MAVVFTSFEDLERFVAPLIEGIAKAVGPYCEVVLHDLSKMELGSSIVRIENGEVTGRIVGGPSTNLGLELLAAPAEGENADGSGEANKFGYYARAGNGNELRCSSVYFEDADGKLLGSLCINVNLTPFQVMQKGLSDILQAPEADEPLEDHEHTEIFASDVDGLLDSLLESAIAATSVPVPMMSKSDRVDVFRYLDKRGAFFIKHSIPKTAKRLGVSRVSAYSYLDEARTA